VTQQVNDLLVVAKGSRREPLALLGQELVKHRTDRRLIPRRRHHCSKRIEGRVMDEGQA
jgi:hypothetical protein